MEFKPLLSVQDKDPRPRLRKINAGSHFNRRLKLWAALKWTTLIAAIIFVVGYVITLMLIPPFSNLNYAYPKYWGKIGFYIHALPGSVWLILGALQQFSWIRAKNPKAHHVMGYIALVFLYISIIGGFIICLSGEAEGGLTLAIDGVVMFIGWGICGAFGWYYIKFQYNVDRHREWMFRAYVLSYVIVLMRPAILLLLYFVSSLTGGEALAIIAPLFFILATASMELRIRLERENQANTEAHFMSLPKLPSTVRDANYEHQLVAYRDDFVPVKLSQKIELTHNTALFVFQLPVKASLLMFPGHHIVLRSRIEGRLVVRPYSPVTSLVRFLGDGTTDNERMQTANISGTIALAVKKYRNGAMSSWLHDSVNVGDSVEMMGPMGGFYYYPNEYDSIGIIAGGTGITPILGVIMAALGNSEDETKFRLIYVNSSQTDAILYEELQQLSDKFADRLTVQMLNGTRINRNVIRECLPRPGKDTQILICGPTGFATSVQKMLRREKYAERSVFTFGESDK